MGNLHEITGGWRPWVVLLGVLGVLLAGCPESGDDDSADDDDAGDDDASDDDAGDDDAGDDDAGDDDAMGDGSGTWTITDATDCGPVRSVVWFEYVEVRAFDGIFASSEPHTCQLWNETNAAMEAAWGTYDAALKKATAGQDGPMACAAALAYYTELEQLDSTLWPPGSCTLELHPDAYTPGDYMAGLGVRGGYPYIWGAWYVAIDSWFAPHVAYLTKECANVSTWGDWTTLEQELWYLNGGDSEFWELYAGMVTLAAGEDLGVSATGLEVMDWETKQQGTLDFDLQAAACSP